ncbi:MAG: STAS/SEC14 domain-containing protein [Bacteroidetes bacterium]|nr:STAS/SEC14 domain-containing protein [Bacteroidota bacterium]
MTTNAQQGYTIFFDKDIDTVVMVWKGYSTSEEFREGTELMLNELINSGTSKVLGDVREMVLIGMEDQRWLETKFLPRAIKFGFKQIAIVTPNSYFNKVAIESVSYKVDKEKISIQFFDTREDAVKWLTA